MLLSALTFAARCPSLALALIAVALAALVPAAAEPSRLIDTDMPGFDYRHFDLPRSSPRLCQEACLSEQACRAWTFVKPGLYGDAHAACWLKYRVPDADADPCCVSGLR